MSTQDRLHRVRRPLAQSGGMDDSAGILSSECGADSNRRPLACHASALPAELPPHDFQVQNRVFFDRRVSQQYPDDYLYALLKNHESIPYLAV